MNKWFIHSVSFALASALPVAMAQESSPGELVVQAWNASDSGLALPSLNCATAIKELKRYHQYFLVTAASLQGPPGVLFVLEGPRSDVVLLKCGTTGEDHSGGEG